MQHAKQNADEEVAIFPHDPFLILFFHPSGAYCDETQLSFITDGFRSSISDSNDQKPAHSIGQLFKSNTSAPPLGHDDASIDSVASANRVPSPAPGGATMALPREPSGVELESLISNVRDILPDLGEGFIEAALEEYAYNSESVINALLEDNLTPKLRSMDRSNAKRKPKKPPPAPQKFEEEHKNIYDDVGFDGLKDMHVGKKETAKNTKTMLDDKSHVDKAKYLAYANADVGSGSIYDQVRFMLVTIRGAWSSVIISFFVVFIVSFNALLIVVV